MDISDPPARGCSFCKILLSEISLHDKMMFPEKFVRKYGEQLHVRVFLKVPGGKVWHVDSVRDGDKVGLQNGWPEFARFYSLSFGHFLVFKYLGNSHFDIFMYDRSGTEVDYPIFSRTQYMDEQGNPNLLQYTKVSKRVNIDTGELKACKKTRVNSACTEACHIGECPMRKIQIQKVAEVTSDKALVGRLEDDSIQPLDMIKPKKDLSREDMATQIEGTSATRPGLSGGFRMSTKGRLTKPFVIGLPAAAYGEKGNYGSSSRTGPQTKGKKAGLHLGSSTSDEGKAKAALASAKRFKSKNPSFILNVLPSFLVPRSQVDIKRAFAQRYMGNNQNFEVCLRVNGKTWPVTCLAYQDRCRFGRGWSQFAEGNSLSVGDVCVFELVNHNQMLLQVFIYRAAKF